MPVRDVGVDDALFRTVRPTLILRSGPHWTPVCFFGALGVLHLTIFSLALLHRHDEGFMSLIFGISFSLAAIAGYLARGEIAVLSNEQRLRLRTGFRKMRIERFVPFSDVHSVRLTLGHGPDHAHGLVEVVCGHEVIECPPTQVAREEALCLAITIGVRLVKISNDQVRL